MLQKNYSCREPEKVTPAEYDSWVEGLFIEGDKPVDLCPRACAMFDTSRVHRIRNGSVSYFRKCACNQEDEGRQGFSETPITQVRVESDSSSLLGKIGESLIKRFPELEDIDDED